MTSTLQCKFMGYVHDIRWYLVSLVVRDHGTFYSGSSYRFLATGNQYYQSTIQNLMINGVNYYINELTILDRKTSIGPYYCATTASYTSMSTHLITSKTAFQLTKFYIIISYDSTALGFIYRNRSHRNNSVILIQSEDFSTTNYLPFVMCVTNNQSCCSSNDGSSDWYHPSGEQVNRTFLNSNQECCAQSFNIAFMFERHYNALILFRSLFINNCFGLYRCLIPDEDGNPQQLFLGVYNARCK